MPQKKQRGSCKFLPLIDLPNNVPFSLRQGLACFTAPRIQESLGEKFIRLDRILIFSQMIRDRWDSKFRYFDRPKPGEDKKGYELKSRLFCKMLDLIQEVDLLNPIDKSTPPLAWFFLVVNELQVDALHLIPPSGFSGQIETKTQARQILQGQNRQIKAYENPFSAIETPDTYKFIERARILAQALDKFRENYYTPFRQARETLTTHLLAQGLLYKDQGKGFQPNRQGRTSTKLPQKK